MINSIREKTVPEVWQEIQRGAIAFMTGKLKIDGNMVSPSNSKAYYSNMISTK